MKTFIAGLVGGVILIVWGALAWTVLPLHDSSVRTISNEDTVVAAMREAITVEGVYYFPGMPQEREGISVEERQAAEAVWSEKHRRGPIGILVYDPAGSEPSMLKYYLTGLIISVIAALIAAWFLSRSTAAASPYLARVTYCGMLGIFASFVTHLPYWNWMGFPADFTVAMVIDVVVGWLLAGLGIAAIIKAPKPESA